MTFSQFGSILRARWWVAALVLALTVGTTLAVSLLLPKQYSATASVVVDFKPDPISAVVYGGIPSPAVMATQLDILTSERVSLRVVRNLKLNENPQLRQQWLEETRGEGTVEQWLLAVFAKSIDVEPSRDSSVIRVSYRAPDAQLAATMANAFVQAYMETTLELRVNPARQYSGFFEQQVKEARDALEAAQGRLSAFQQTNRIVASDERVDIETQRLNELSSQLVALQAVAAESRSREAQARGAASDRMQEVIGNALISSIKADITRAEGRLQELNSRFGERHPQVIEAKANLGALRARLDTETGRVTGSVGVNSVVNNQREAQVRAVLDSQRDKVLRLKALRDEAVLLLRDVESSQRAYESVKQRLAQTNLESQTTQSNANLLTHATPPAQPSAPRIALNTGLAVFLGILLAAGTVLLLELADRRVRTLDDVAQALDLPVLGVMPRPGSGRKSISAMQQRLMAPQPPTTSKAA